MAAEASAAVPVAIGYDWDERGGVFAAVNADGRTLARIRVTPTTDGLAKVRALGERFPNLGGVLPVIVVEDTRRPMLRALADAGFHVVATNPDALRSFRKNYGTNTRKKTDEADASMLAVRYLMFPHQHRTVLYVDATALELTHLVRMERALTWQGVDAANRLRSALAEANPAVLEVWAAAQFTDTISTPTFIGNVPSAAALAALTQEGIEDLLRASGRGSRITDTAAKIVAATSLNWITYPPEVDEAMGRIIAILASDVRHNVEARTVVKKRIVEVLDDCDAYHLLKDSTGAGPIILARVLSEVGVDQVRFTNLSGLLAYAAVVPFTEQSGSRQRDVRRMTRGNRLHSAMWDWACAAVVHHPGAKTYYWTRVAAGDYHPTAIRKVASKLTSAMWHCLTTGEMWADKVVWPNVHPDLDEFVKTTRAAKDARKSVKAVNHGIKAPAES